jgi:mevalonate kinase
MNPTLLQTLQNIVTSANEILDTKDVKRKKNKFEDLVKKIKEAYGLLKRIIKETSELAPVVSVIVEAFIKVIKLILETF